MSRERFGFPSLVVILLCVSSTCRANTNQSCNPSSCGHIRNISYPFRLKSDPEGCGDSDFELECNNSQTIIYWNHRAYHVQSINYENSTIRILDPGIRKKQCPPFSIYSVPYEDLQMSDYYYYLYFRTFNTPVMFVSCLNHVKSSVYVDTVSCNTKNALSNNTSSSLLREYSYVLLGDQVTISDIVASCKINNVAWFSKEFPIIDTTSFLSILDSLAYGFSLHWYPAFLHLPTTGPATIIDYQKPSRLEMIWEGNRDFWIANSSRLIELTVKSLLGRLLCGLPFLVALLIYKYRRQHLSIYDSIEDFLQGQKNLVPIRYSYREIREMTNNFKDKLGEGGYGSVFKGKLRSGPFVAIKLMNKSTASGQEFFNEVATIGRIHHVNVVQLIGFCVDGSKRAVVYEFMPNSSLDKYIFSQEDQSISLSYEKMFEISLGVARGIDYIHQGCDMQILHFDIKPHNILLDENFTPKISDFGLAKLYKTDDSIASLTAARGTMGYMAPELFYKNIGRVSYKADVYSYGMLLMEMAGRRKNLNPFVENLSQIYFPSWVYDQFNEGKEIGMGDSSEEERKMVKRMVLVALWCIQMKPADRPSMNTIVEMLEGDAEHLQMPPKPFLYPEESPAEDYEIHANNDEVPLFSGNINIDSTSLDQDD